MIFNVITIMAPCVAQSLNHGVVGRSFDKGQNSLNFVNPRTFTEDVHQTVDGRPYGGGDGMIMLPEPLGKSLESLRVGPGQGPIFMLSPQGALWTDGMATQVSQEEQATFICGRYGGVDERFLKHYGVQEVSIGDYVLSGGELACAVIIDSIVRKIPQVLGHKNSAHEDSFADGNLLEAPQFTRPRQWKGLEVPDVLVGGNHKKIEEFKQKVSWLVTLQKRPELIKEGPPENWGLAAFLLDMPDMECRSLGLSKGELLEKLKEFLS